LPIVFSLLGCGRVLAAPDCLQASRGLCRVPKVCCLFLSKAPFLRSVVGRHPEAPFKCCSYSYATSFSSRTHPNPRHAIKRKGLLISFPPLSNSGECCACFSSNNANKKIHLNKPGCYVSKVLHLGHFHPVIPSKRHRRFGSSCFL